MNYTNFYDTYLERYGYNNIMIEDAADSVVREVTFQVTEACNLCCTYCYQIQKSPKIMSWDTAKACVDILFQMYYDNVAGSFINQKTEVIIFDFIGGEPLLQVNLMDKIITYFFERSIIEIPKWAETFMISFATNGTLMNRPEVQKFMKKYVNRLSASVSIDGMKEMHDACRVFPDGSGSFDLAYKAQKDLEKIYGRQAGTKATISRENMTMLPKTIKYYIEEGYTQINANTIYEPDWTTEDAQLYYTKLKEMANILLPYNEHVHISLFDKTFFQPRTDMKQPWCGGYDSMLAFDTEGNMYPCIRYMESSLGSDAPPVIIGDAWHGMYYTKEQQEIHKCLACTTWWSQNDEECRNCPIAQGCADCAAEGYQHFGQFNKRHKLGSCWVHRARSLANVYYWNMLYRQNGLPDRFHRYLPDDIALQIISPEELALLNKLESTEE